MITNHIRGRIDVTGLKGNRRSLELNLEPALWQSPGFATCAECPLERCPEVEKAQSVWDEVPALPKLSPVKTLLEHFIYSPNGGWPTRFGS